MPTDHGYEVEDIDDDILHNIFQYQYIDGQFVINENYHQSKLQQVRATKIANLKSICNRVITTGIDFNEEHYSLTSDDQLNLMKLESIATLTPQTPLFYHADGQLCRPYSAEEIKAIATSATLWITYHTTYFNFAKNQINAMSNVDDIIAMQYGSPLQEPYESQIQQLTQGMHPSLTIVQDSYNYQTLYPTVDVQAIRDSLRINQALSLDQLDNILGDMSTPTEESSTDSTQLEETNLTEQMEMQDPMIKEEPLTQPAFDEEESI